MKVFVTGATGLLGLNTIPHLLDAGHSLRVLVRDSRKAARVLPKDPRIDVVVGDLENPDVWLAQLDGCDALIHAAAYFREYFARGEHGDLLNRYNVALPARLYREAKTRGVQHVVMVSSSGVLEPRPDGLPTDESGEPGAYARANAYFWSKVEMERALDALTSEVGVPLAIVRPGWMFGPHDHAPTSAGQFARDLIEKRVTTLVDGTPLGVADARDVGLGIARIVAERKSGVYNLCGLPQTALSAVKTLAAEVGGGARVNAVPFPLAVLGARFLEGPTRLLGKPNPIPLEGVRTLHFGVFVTSEKAERELGIAWRPFAETARDTVAFFRSLT